MGERKQGLPPQAHQKGVQVPPPQMTMFLTNYQGGIASPPEGGSDFIVALGMNSGPLSVTALMPIENAEDMIRVLREAVEQAKIASSGLVPGNGNGLDLSQMAEAQKLLRGEKE